MILFKSAAALAAHAKTLQSGAKTIGFVPTMGALHNGHLSLIEESKKENDITLCSIFINPTQFNNADDFNLYPVTIEKDIELLTGVGCDILFLPSVAEMYPKDHIKKHYPLGGLEHVLEGFYRPGHFQGVSEVIDRFLTIINPDTLYLGQKDYQQCMVVKKLMEVTGRQTPTLKFVATRREESGLALSSRNLRLNAEEKNTALIIAQTLWFIKEALPSQPIAVIKEAAVQMLEQKGLLVDYVEVADADNLQPIEQYNSSKKTVALIAATLGSVRLIDNMVLN